MELIWLPEARADIHHLFDFLIEVNPAAAGRAVRAISSGADRLRFHPKLGHLMEDGQRRELFLPFGGGAYILRYRLEGDTVVIIRVWHGREHRD